LVALSSDLPNTLALHLQVGDLFVSVGDNPRALDQFEQALGLAPQDRVALAGAGRAAFATGDYEKAQRDLHDLPDPSGDLQDERAVADLVLSGDPLATRIGSSARRHRLTDALAHLSQALERCTALLDHSQAQVLLQLVDETSAFTNELVRNNALENDTIENGLELVNRGERAVAKACPPAQPFDRALMLIAARHGVAIP
jgi:tetratricopeptide (TPR) repeat protein